MEFEDRSYRDSDDDGEDIIRAVDDGNASLARTFALLAEQLERAVEAEEYARADELIGVIDRLSSLATVGR